MKPTAEQMAFVEASRTGESICGLARAGTGKTSALCFAADACSDRSILFLSFSKSAQLDAERRLRGRPWVEVKTPHSVAYGAVGKYYKDRLTVNPFEVRAWIRKHFE